MGSGLILLAIVGAWLAVLVPMALRRYDTSHIVTVDKFHDAMRVLSRRSGPDQDPDPGTPAPAPGRFRISTDAVKARAEARRARPALSAAARRRRLLAVLVTVSLGTLAGVVVGPLWLLAPHLLADLALVAFVVHLRKTAVARAEREWRTAMRPEAGAATRAAARPATRPAARPAARTTARPAVPAPAVAAPVARPVLQAPAHVAGIPDRMPPRPAPLVAPAPVETVPAARGAQGEAWSPVPVPTPTYLSAPTAPRRVVDVTRPGSYAEGDGLTDAERELGIVDEGPQLDDILERRRAVNDW